MNLLRISILSILGIFCVSGLIILIPFIEDIILSKTFSDDILEALLLIIPSIFSGFLFYKLIKNPELFDRYHKTISFFSWGIAITIFVGIIMSLIVLILGDSMGFLGVLGEIFLGAFISFIAAIVGWSLDRKAIKQTNL